jgi:hypothetical protein
MIINAVEGKFVAFLRLFMSFLHFAAVAVDEPPAMIFLVQICVRCSPSLAASIVAMF